MTREAKIKEIENKIQELKLKKDEAKKEADKFNAMQLALKLVLNGSYGAWANKHFVLFCNGVASTITAHGRDLTQTMNRVNEDYWYNQWHLDTEIHRELEIHRQILEYIEWNDLNKEMVFSKEGISKLEEIKKEIKADQIQAPKIEPIDHTYVDISGNVVQNPTEAKILDGEIKRNVSVSVYADTDSLFVSYKPAIKGFKWDQNPLDFILKMSELKIQPYFNKKLEEYAAGYNIENKQDFELEQVSKSIIFLEKKMYVKNVVWEEGVFSDPETNIQPKGVDLVRSSSPAFTREYVPKILNYFFKNADSISDRGLVKHIRELKEMFKLQPIENISMGSSCSNYETKIIDDQDSLKWVKGTHYAVKAAALHNYLLNNNSKFKSKYNLLKGGQKIKYYYTTNKLNGIFAYASGQYPKEIANKHAPIDIDKQFEKTILNSVNRFVRVLGLSELNSQLSFTLSLF